jgi:G3E family GTPase
MEVRTPIMLITGSLGSGKTTLLRRILDTSDLRIAVVMNEFGEIAIDSRVIQGENVQIVELTGGCVCCSITGEFEAAVREIIETVKPELIAVEATGVAEADALVYEVEDNLPEVRLDCVVSIVDAYLSIKYPSVGYTTRTQLEVADIVLVNKIDLVTTDEEKEVEAQIRRYNDVAIFFKTVGCDLDTHLLFGLDLGKRAFSLNHHGEAEFHSFTYTTESLLDEGKFRETAMDLPPSVFRAKGFVRFPGGSCLFNYVIGRPELEPFHADKTQLVFIGRHLETDEQDILNRLRESEIQQYAV